MLRQLSKSNRQPRNEGEDQKIRILIALWLSVIAFAITVIYVFTIYSMGEDGHGDLTYLRLGPSNTTFVFFTIPLNTQSRYWGFVLVLAILQTISTVASEWGGVLHNYIYNPQMTQMTAWYFWEIQLITNIFWLLGRIHSVLVTIIGIGQIDLALWSILFAQLTSIPLIWDHLKDRHFKDSYGVIERGEANSSLGHNVKGHPFMPMHYDSHGISLVYR